MLGRLEMTVSECIEVYTNLSEHIFTTSLVQCGICCCQLSMCCHAGARYSTKALEDEIKNIVRRSKMRSSDALFFDDRARCRT